MQRAEALELAIATLKGNSYLLQMDRWCLPCYTPDWLSVFSMKNFLSQNSLHCFIFLRNQLQISHLEGMWLSVAVKTGIVIFCEWEGLLAVHSS